MQRVRKKLSFALVLLLLINAVLILTTLIAQPKTEHLVFEKHSGTALVITGAAARIVQEAALLENLQKNGWLTNICFISGTSSGAINTVMLNGILERKFTWERYFSILFNISTHDIYIRKGKTLPVNNEPLQNLLVKVINDSLGYKSIGDLPFESSISISAVDLLPPFSATYRLCNLKINEESNPDFNLVETLLASTAIPILFPAARFKESFGLPKSAYVDGGFSNDHIPFEAVLQFEKFRGFGVDTLIIVSRKSDTKQGIQNEVAKFGDTDSRTFDKMSYWIDNLAMNGFIRSMKEIQKEYPELAARTYVYIPDFEENFALLDFSEMRRQYEVTANWAETHKPIPLNQYLDENTRDDKLKVMENDK